MCSSDGVTVDSASVDDPLIFEATPDRTMVSLKALAPGQTTVRANGYGGSYQTEVEAKRATRIEVSLTCDYGVAVDGGVPPDALFLAESRFWLNTRPFAGDTALVGSPERPVRCDVATDEGAPGRFIASTTAARGTITSEHDAALAMPIRIFTAPEITAEMPPPHTLWGLSSPSFYARVLVDGKRPCIETIERRYQISTPDICDFTPQLAHPDGGLLFEQSRLGPNEVRVHRRKSGVCIVRATFPARPDLMLEQSHTFP